ncbi:FxsA family protein [Desulforamulus aeronauticus]|uniref:UPF0716 protein FxsA n=1 Tax=Desulforamulus aeronauticus DSM 10349 TaxID=1121421 RepID=A0A1M6URB6_9FIRM|nr:FxsA family protein [Desulforamulus aeronauticus]SHK71720.1 UPF0716 protein FxsA [Desulforamulus aeronauticus DSM 10349]
MARYRILPTILVLLLMIPVIEIFILIQASRWFGFGFTVTVLIFLALLGFYLIKSQGFAIIGQFRREISMGQVPTAPLLDGLMILASGLLLLIPGLLTDFMGLILLMPAVRLTLRKKLTGYLIKFFVPERFIRIRW